MRVGRTSTAKLCYHRNQQYSVTALTDTTGTISERYAYDAYGNLTVLDGSGTVLSGSAYGNRYTYTGREWDEELALYHYRARMYDPVAGRFASRDPIGYDDDESLYQYTHNRPTVGTDPTGLSDVNPYIPPSEVPNPQLPNTPNMPRGNPKINPRMPLGPRELLKLGCRWSPVLVPAVVCSMVRHDDFMIQYNCGFEFVCISDERKAMGIKWNLLRNACSPENVALPHLW